MDHPEGNGVILLLLDFELHAVLGMLEMFLIALYPLLYNDVPLYLKVCASAFKE